MSEEDVPLNTLAAVYLKIRAAEHAVQTKYDNELEALKAQKTQVQLAMKDQLLALKAKSVKTDAGLVILSTKTRFYPTDWEAFHKFVKEHDAIDLLERRVAQGNMKKYLEDNPDQLPPGLNANTEYDISVRKP
jgi:L-cysteine desulfidase